MHKSLTALFKGFPISPFESHTTYSQGFAMGPIRAYPFKRGHSEGPPLEIIERF